MDMFLLRRESPHVVVPCAIVVKTSVGFVKKKNKKKKEESEEICCKCICKFIEDCFRKN